MDIIKQHGGGFWRKYIVFYCFNIRMLNNARFK